MFVHEQRTFVYIREAHDNCPKLVRKERNAKCFGMLPIL